MIKGKVTTAALRKIPVGGSETFKVPDALAIDTGKTLAYRAQHILHCRFSAVSDYTNNTITLTKSKRHD